MNTIGTSLKLTLFGASHGPCVGAVLDGCPPGLGLSLERIQSEVDLRRPSGPIGTSRAEEDKVELVSGVVDGTSTGGPITFIIWNKDADSSKYEKFKTVPRPGHADLTALGKYGPAHDLRGGGQFSGRMTAPLVAAGAVARFILSDFGIRIAAYSQAIGAVEDAEEHEFSIISSIPRTNPVRAADAKLAKGMEREILRAKKEGDSVGGVVRCQVAGLPIGVGEPFFDTVEGELAKMMFAIPAVKGFDCGAGFRAAKMRGSEHNDRFVLEGGKIASATNHAGGVLGGISNGMPIDFRVAFKPTASISKEQRSVDLKQKKETTLRIGGRHDPCIVPRAVVVVESAAALVIADLCQRGGFFA
jgi:chorismate synthase